MRDGCIQEGNPEGCPPIVLKGPLPHQFEHSSEFRLVAFQCKDTFQSVVGDWTETGARGSGVIDAIDQHLNKLNRFVARDHAEKLLYVISVEVIHDSKFG